MTNNHKTDTETLWGVGGVGCTASPFLRASQPMRLLWEPSVKAGES